MSYVLSSANRWYCGLESSYGTVPTVTGANRIPAIKLTARQQFEKATRRDKTGGGLIQEYRPGPKSYRVRPFNISDKLDQPVKTFRLMRRFSGRVRRHSNHQRRRNGSIEHRLQCRFFRATRTGREPGRQHWR